MYKVVGEYLDYDSYGVHFVSEICETLEVAEKLATEMRQKYWTKETPMYTEVSIHETEFVNGVLKTGKRI